MEVCIRRQRPSKRFIYTDRVLCTWVGLLAISFIFALPDRAVASEPQEPGPSSPGSTAETAVSRGAAPISTGGMTAVPSAGAGSVPTPPYKIGYSDVLRVSVWKEPDLTATVAVRTDGMISLPLVNDVQAEGLTPMQLAANLTDKLKRYVEDPRVTVVVSQMTSQRVYIVGEVARRGPMGLVPDMTVFQALASAGPTQFANTKKIYVMRTVDHQQRKFFVNYKQLIKGQRMNQNIKLEAGDTIVVP